MLAKTPLPTEAKLTDKLVDKLPLAGSPGAPKDVTQYTVRDTEQRGFCVRIGRTTKTWTAQADAKLNGERKSFKIALGRTDEKTVAAARRTAADWLSGIKSKSRLPEHKAPKSLTLGEAWEAYRVRCEKRERQPGTIAVYAEHIERGPLKNWQAVPLSELGADSDLVSRWFDEITIRSGPHRANSAARTLSAVYRYAAKKLDRSLPPSPTTAIEMNPVRKSTGGFGLDARLELWGDEVAALPPIRREFHLLTLLSGSRPDALSKARWSDIDVARRVLHIPEPKGGPKRAFDIPLSRPMILSLARLRRTGRFLFPGSKYVFPARSNAGHLTCWSENRKTLSAYGRDLRRSYRTICAHLGIPRIISMALMNHISGSDVHDGYIETSALSSNNARAQETISAAIIQRAFRDPKRTAAFRDV